MFKAETLDAVGGRLYPWQNGPRAKSGRGGGVPMAGTPSHALVATERCLRFSHGELRLHTEDSITVFNLRVDPACFTLAPSVTRLGAEAPLRTFQTARLLQATGSVPVTFAVPFCTRPDPGEDDYVLVIGLSFASWRTSSCLGRRMADTAAFCVDHLFPRVPTRQHVLSLPYALRFKMAYSADATSVVLGAFINAINSDLRRRARKRKLRGRLQTGSLTVVQRFGSSLNLNVHFHVIAMDGLYAKQPDGSMLFHPLPAPSDEDIARLARSVQMRFGE